MKRIYFVIILVITGLLLCVSIIPGSSYNENWALLSALILGLAVLAFFWRFEKMESHLRKLR